MGKDGKTLRETLEAVARLKRSRPQEIDNPHQFPQMYADVWMAFMNLDAYRGSNGFSAMPMSYLEIDAYCRLTHSTFTDFEISLLKNLDVISLNAKAKRDNK